MVDEQGMPIRLIITSRQASEMVAAPVLIGSLRRSRHIIADRDYDARTLVELAKQQSASARTPTQRNRKHQRSVDPAFYRQRNLIERYFIKIKHFRRIATRFDKLSTNFLAVVALVSIRLWARNYESTI